MRWNVGLLSRLLLGFLGLSLIAAADARAAAYPDHTVRIIVGYPAGGSTDIVARLIGNWLSQKLGQQFIVENKPGAGNNIGTELAAKAAPDGYTLLLVNPANTINATLYKNLNFVFPARHRPGRQLHPGAQRDGGQSEGAGEDGQGVHRLRQSQSRQGQHRLVRQRHLDSSVRRIVQDDDRR